MGATPKQRSGLLRRLQAQGHPIGGEHGVIVAGLGGLIAGFGWVLYAFIVVCRVLCGSIVGFVRLFSWICMILYV